MLPLRNPLRLRAALRRADAIDRHLVGAYAAIGITTLMLFAAPVVTALIAGARP